MFAQENDVPESTNDILTMIGLIVGGGGIASAIFYNALKINQSTKSQYYQILKDLHLRFDEIQHNKEGISYRMQMTNLGLFIKELIDAKIIPKKYVVQPFKFVFAESLWNIKRMSKQMTQEHDIKKFVEFCEKNKITEDQPPEWTLQDD